MGLFNVGDLKNAASGLKKGVSNLAETAEDKGVNLNGVKNTVGGFAKGGIVGGIKNLNAKGNEAEEELTQKLSQAPFVKNIANEFEAWKNEYPWITEEDQDYMDDKRMVSIFVKGLVVQAFNEYEKEYTREDGSIGFGKFSDIHRTFALSFRKSGLNELSAYKASNGKTLHEGKVCEAFAKVIQENMAAKWPEFTYEKVTCNYLDDEQGYCASFIYSLPAKERQSWF